MRSGVGVHVRRLKMASECRIALTNPRGPSQDDQMATTNPRYAAVPRRLTLCMACNPGTASITWVQSGAHRRSHEQGVSYGPHLHVGALGDALSAWADLRDPGGTAPAGLWPGSPSPPGPPMTGRSSWRRGCSCELCETLGVFLGDRTRRSFEWPLAEPRRRHIHSRIDMAELPVHHQTRRSGRPYTLVLTKTNALFARETRERDQTDLAWLRSADGISAVPTIEGWSTSSAVLCGSPHVRLCGNPRTRRPARRQRLRGGRATPARPGRAAGALAPRHHVIRPASGWLAGLEI